MTPKKFNDTILQPALNEVLPIIGIPPSDAATHLLLAIAGQESAWKYRYQIVRGKPGKRGYARGFFQFERNGGVAGILTHPATKKRALKLTRYLKIPHEKRAIWENLETNDRLAVGFARLLLWSDPRALAVSEKSAWSYYKRNWRPGRPHPRKWPKIWKQTSKTAIA